MMEDGMVKYGWNMNMGFLGMELREKEKEKGRWFGVDGWMDGLWEW